jgi:hypothetical protein
MAHDVPLGCAPDEYDDLISGTCSHLPEAIDNLRYIISYLAKEEQKHGHYHYGASEVPSPSGLGRPRTV